MVSVWVFYSVVMIWLLHYHHHYHLADASSTLSRNKQKLALFQFKHSFSVNTSPQRCDEMPSRNQMKNWNMSSDYCKWEGVTCNQTTGDVIVLKLICSHLVGSIHPNSSMFQLSSLQVILFNHNDFRGVMPEEIFHLPNLKELYIGNSPDLSVRLPKVKWGSSTTLQILSLYKTTIIGGNVPDSIVHLKSLRDLSFWQCNLSGPIPKSITNLTQLTDLYLEDNDLSGQLPSWLANFTRLTHLALGGNHFSGQIPEFLAKLQNLESLSLNNNNLNGPFPSWVANLTQLQHLDLQSNSLFGPLPSYLPPLSLLKLGVLYLMDNSLNGTVPSWLFELPSLSLVYIGSNKFTGQLHKFNSSRSSLLMFDCSNNLLYGTIPNTFSELVNLTSLDFSSNNFSVVLDLETFAHLQYLDTLELSHNSLIITDTATLPPSLLILGLSSCKITEFPHFIRSLQKLAYLDLSNNQMVGEIPTWIGLTGRSSLNYLNLSHNRLTGGVDQLTWSSLQYLDLQYNMLNGSLPTSICNMSSLNLLNLSHNNLSGLLPVCPSSLNYTLSVMDLRMNRIKGSLPPALINFRNLRSINLHGNKLEGTIPLSFSEFHFLEVLDLGRNHINDTFPHFLDALPNLQVLVLKSNKFHGVINPISKIEKSFPILRIIDLSDNEFSGPLPAKYIDNFQGMKNVEVNKTERSYMGDFYYTDSMILVIKGVEMEFVKILTVLTTIDLSRNRFNGNIPKSIGKLVSLRYLNLSHNHLTGSIPPLIANLSVLESLDLSSNQLVGEVPPDFTRLHFLSHLNLSQNDLSGRIPKGAQFDTYDNHSYVGNVGLCGRPLSKMCGGDNTELQEEEEEHEDDDGFTWEAVVIGYGSGVVVGLVAGYIMFMVGKPKWYVDIIAINLGFKVRRIEIRST